MSPPGVTLPSGSQPPLSGSDRDLPLSAKGRQNGSNYTLSSAMEVDLALASGNTTNIAGLALATSTVPNQPLSGAPQMAAALEAIVPCSTRSRGQVRATGNSFARLEAMHREATKRARSPSEDPVMGKRARGLATIPAEYKAAQVEPAVTEPSRRHPGAPQNYISISTTFRTKCAIAVGVNEPIGNPFAGTGKAWQVILAINGGRTGTPSVGLTFYMTTDSQKNDEHHQNVFTCGWTPGVVAADGGYMMEDLLCCSAENPPADFPNPENYILPDKIRQQAMAFTGNKKKISGKVAYLTFRSRANKCSEYDERWPTNLPYPSKHPELKNIFDSLDKLLVDAEDSQIQMWFLVPESSYEKGAPRHIEPIRDAVKASPQLPPMAQYMNASGNVQLDFEMKSIDVFGDDMYIKEPEYLKDDQGRCVGVAHKGDRLKFIAWQRKITWDTIKHFHIYQGVPVVREQQFQRTAMANLRVRWHRVFVQKAPTLRVNGKSLTPEREWFKRTFFAGVRLWRDPNTGTHEVIPAEGSVIKADFWNGNPRKGHERQEAWLWYGRVVPRSKAWYDITKCDFCIMLTKPRNCLTVKVYKKEQYQPDEKLDRVNLEVKMSNTAYQRELGAIKLFCDETFQPEHLGPLRLAAMLDPDLSASEDILDLTYGPSHNISETNKVIYDSYVEALDRESADNPRQIEALRSAARMVRNTVCVGGPPGAGKTRTLRSLIIGLAKVGHTVLSVATANSAVDTDAIAIYQTLSVEERKTIVCLRLESASTEHAMILKKTTYTDYAHRDAADMPAGCVEPYSADEDLGIQNALEAIALNYAQHANRVDEIL